MNRCVPHLGTPINICGRLPSKAVVLGSSPSRNPRRTAKVGGMNRRFVCRSTPFGTGCDEGGESRRVTPLGATGSFTMNPKWSSNT